MQRQLGLDGPVVGYLTSATQLATGATHTYFGRDDWAPIAPGLKRIDDATLIRRRLLMAFERAENTDDPKQRRALTTFVIVGGGPTGVEMAGAIAELAQHALAADFRAIDPRDTRIILVEGASRLLGAFPEPLSEYARQELKCASTLRWWAAIRKASA